MVDHHFGGPWTEQKLEALRKYLEQYRLIFTRNLGAQKLRTVYVDAFAGTGERDIRDTGKESLFAYTEETREFQEGSARKALSLASPFDEYVFH